MRPPVRSRFHPWARRVTEPLSIPSAGVTREREVKFKIPDQATFERLLRGVTAGKPPAPVLQWNHIFDTPDRALSHDGYRLRLREEEGRWLLTAKGPKRSEPPERGSGDESVVDRPEVESALSAELAHALIEGRASPLELLSEASDLGPADRSWATALAERYAEPPVELLGHFVNERTRLPWQSADGLRCTLELDRTHFPGNRTDYELEVELPPGSDGAAQVALEAALRRWLEDAGVRPERSSGKVRRFFQALDEQARPHPPVDRFS